MAKGGRRYPLVVYTHMLDRWRPAVFTIGLGLIGLAGSVYYVGFERWRWMMSVGIGVLCIIFSIIMTIFRKSGYVQPFPNYLLVATPILRLNISYKRIRRTTTANMGALFPPKSVSNLRADIIEPLAKNTVIIIEMTGHPMSQTMLRFFLSPLFFKDKTPHLVIMVEEWMKFSAELESMRAGRSAEPDKPSPPPQKPRTNSILSKLPAKK